MCSVSIVVTLTCLVDEEMASAALEEGSKLQTTDVCDIVSPSLLEDCVSINSVKELFTPAAWHQVKQMLVALKKNPLWHCGTCHEEIEEEGDNCVFCDRCLSWLRYRCTKSKMTKPPASTYWFCCKCKTWDVTYVFTLNVFMLSGFSLCDRNERGKKTVVVLNLSMFSTLCYWLSLVSDGLHLDTPVNMFYI